MGDPQEDCLTCCRAPAPVRCDKEADSLACRWIVWERTSFDALNDEEGPMQCICRTLQQG
jgi:hypothetical protein